MPEPAAPPLLRHAPATVHGRYLVEAAAADAACWLIGFHGYAQSAEIFLPLLAAVPRSAAWRAVAVQGLHPFYTRNDRDVVAHWMTRQDRELAIADNIAYVDTVLEKLREEFGAPRAIAFAGFSQGVGMAYRAGLRGRHAAAGIFAACGDVPPDVLDVPAAAWPPVCVAAGGQDAWYGADRLEHDVAKLRECGVEAQSLLFAGGHEWGAPVLEAAGEFLARISAPG